MEAVFSRQSWAHLSVEEPVKALRLVSALPGRRWISVGGSSSSKAPECGSWAGPPPLWLCRCIPQSWQADEIQARAAVLLLQFSDDFQLLLGAFSGS